MSSPHAAKAGAAPAEALLPVQERDAADFDYADFLREFVETGTPVVVHNAVSDWPALHKWTPAYFKDRFGDKQVNISYREKLSFAEFIDQAEASTTEKPGPYMYRLFLHEHLPEVLPDLAPQCAFSFPRRYASPLMPSYWRRPDGYQKLLIGGVGGRFPVTHFDTENVHASITQVYGQKEFILIPPEDSVYMYPSPLQANHSLVPDPLSPDLGNFPLFAQASVHRTVMGPGDMVFVPCGWWHSARALSMSISIGMNMVDRSNWAGFVSEVSQGSSALRSAGKRTYLTALGTVLSAAEALQEKMPQLARRLQWPRRLSPVSSAVAADPALSPLRIRFPTA